MCVSLAITPPPPVPPTPKADSAGHADASAALLPALWAAVAAAEVGGMWMVGQVGIQILNLTDSNATRAEAIAIRLAIATRVEAIATHIDP